MAGTSSTVKPQDNSSSSLQIPFSYSNQEAVLEICFLDPIAHGAQGTLFAAKIFLKERQVEVVVKSFPYVVTLQQKKLLTEQADKWSALDHPHVLQVFGVCSFGFMQTGLVSPRMQNGNMAEFLQRHPDERRLPLLEQVASGLQYLHEADIVHGNLKCTNVLISDSRAALLADFGWSMLVEQAGERTAVNIRERKTVAFEAPELLSSTHRAAAVPESGTVPQAWAPQRTAASDSFAFGMLMYETCAGRIPWSGVPRHDVVSKILAGEHPPREPAGDSMNDDLWELCTRCWSDDPSQRPTASVIHTLTWLPWTSLE